jgi:hypothetical protein
VQTERIFESAVLNQAVFEEISKKIVEEQMNVDRDAALVDAECKVNTRNKLAPL